MGSLIFAYCFGILSVLPLLGGRRLERVVAAADEEHLRGLRRYAESKLAELVLPVWGILAFVTAMIALVRGHAIGYAWLGAAALFALGVFATHVHRARLFDLLGDRGRVESTDRYKRRAATSYRFVAIGATGYIGMKVMDYAFPNDPPSWAAIIEGVSGLVMIVGVVGFLAIRTRMYLSGDDLEPTTEQEQDAR